MVLGPRDSEFADIETARAELNQLIAAGGVVLAGAGIDLGNGFISARLAGAGGDRRDAVLAALRVLGSAGAPRLGERTATLVALFGVTATKPVGAAAERAIAEERWAALTLASAAADLLGPEQLERVLGFTAPADIDPVPGGAASALAVNLRVVLEPFSRPKRAALLADLWRQVCDRQVAVAAQRSLSASQDHEIAGKLSARYRAHAEERLERQARYRDDVPLTVFDALRFAATWDNLWKYRAEWLIEDAIAATVLLRTELAVREHGVAEGISRMREQISAASALLRNSDLKWARSRTPEQLDLPARPGCHVREIDAWLRSQPLNAAFERFLPTRLRTALAYVVVVDTACHDALCNQLPRDDHPEKWASEALLDWREKVGYTEIRPPSEWLQRPVLRDSASGDCLAERLAADPTTRDQPSDLLWYAELADAMLRAQGQARAEIWFEYGFMHFDAHPDPTPVTLDPLTPRPDSVPLAVAGAAQLLSLGATAPPRCRDWVRLCTGLMTSGAVAAALSNEFQIPEPVLAWDGAELPGTATRLQIARNGGHLAEWSDYMGNCIAGQWYQDEAVRGRSILIAVRDDRNVIQVNAELRSTGPGWFADEIKARFNNEPDPSVKKAIQHWALTLRAAEPDPEPPSAETPPRPRRARPNPLREIAPDLYAATRVTLAAAQPALHVITAIAGDPAADPKTLTPVRRSTLTRLTRLTTEALESGRITLPQLWSATATHPLTAAVNALDPALQARYPRLHTLSEDAPLPSKALRAFIKDPEMATARSQEILARRLRTILAHLTLTAAPTLTRAVIAHPETPTLCALIQAITCAHNYPHRTLPIADPRATTIPAFPTTSLSDPNGPWQLAWPDAVTLGADRERFWNQIADTGLLAPADWLNTDGWQALWSRATANSRNG